MDGSSIFLARMETSFGLQCVVRKFGSFKNNDYFPRENRPKLSIEKSGRALLFIVLSAVSFRIT